MHVGNLCHKAVVTVRQSDEISSAAALMRDRHVGYLVVVEPDLHDGSLRPVGVLTDRDLVVSVLAHDVIPQTLCVGDVMTRQPVLIAASESLDKALQAMRRIGVRRLPVVGTLGELQGVLSMDDIIDTLAGQLQAVAGSLRNEQVIEVALRS